MSKRRARKRGRRQVNRSERVKPPREAAQHHRPWPMQELLRIGPPNGIDADDFEAALQIVETFRALTVELATKGLLIDAERIVGGGLHTMSDRDAERIACWFDWSLRLPRGLPPRLVAWIEDDEPIGSVEVLRRACRLWDRVRSDRAKPPVAAVDMPPPHVLTMPRPNLWQNEIVARPVNRPVQTISVPPGLPHQPIPLAPTGLHLCHAEPRPVAASIGRRRP